MFPVESLKKKCGASFEFVFGRAKICSFSAGQTLHTLVLSQPKQAGFQSLPLAGPSNSSEGRKWVQPPGLRRFALGAELGICEFSTPSTSKWCSRSPLLHKLARPLGFVCPGWGWRAEGLRRPAPHPTKPWWGVGGSAERTKMKKDGLRDSGPPLWVTLRIEGGGHVSAPTKMFMFPNSNREKHWAGVVSVELEL